MADHLKYQQEVVETTLANLNRVVSQLESLRSRLSASAAGMAPCAANVRMYGSTAGALTNRQAASLKKLADRSSALSLALREVNSRMLETERLLMGVDIDQVNIPDTPYQWTNMPTGTKDEYDQMIQERHDHAIDEKTRQLYDKYQNQINIGSDHSDSGYYDPNTQEIYYNWQNDGQNVRGQGTTYYHEVGHMIDDYISESGDASSSEAFSHALRDDFENYVQKTMQENNCTREEAYEIISDWLWEDADNKNGLSDLCGGLSNKECEGKWQHSADYWNYGTENGIPMMLNNEAFAHFFEASMSPDPTKLNYLKEVFPNAYNEYQNIVEAAL